MSEERIEAAARALADVRLRRNGARPPIDDLPAAIRPRDLDEAYLVQAVLRRLLAPELEPVAGWKIGCTSPVMQAYLGVDHPAMGTLFAGQLRRREARLVAADFRRLGLECEIAVRLDADLPPGGDPAAAVGGVMCSVEIVEERFADFGACAKESLVADDFFSMGCVLGEEVPLAAVGDLKALLGGFTVNGEAAAEGRGDAILGDPLAALAWLAARRGPEGGLKAGDVATLGSVVKTIYPQEGDRVEASFDRLGAVTVEIA
ncbi:MAG: fumarylacetoacetate hydrolase family protein [Pseudomonadota bacterium]